MGAPQFPHISDFLEINTKITDNNGGVWSRQLNDPISFLMYSVNKSPCFRYNIIHGFQMIAVPFSESTILFYPLLLQCKHLKALTCRKRFCKLRKMTALFLFNQLLPSCLSCVQKLLQLIELKCHKIIWTCRPIQKESCGTLKCFCPNSCELE